MIKSLKLQKPLSVLLALLMFFSSVGIISASASDNEDEGIVPYFSTISSAYAAIKISGIKATCAASLSSQYNANLSITMQLQKKKSGGAYDTVETWKKSSYGSSLSDEQSRAINLLSDYRLVATFVAGGEQTIIIRNS